MTFSYLFTNEMIFYLKRTKINENDWGFYHVASSGSEVNYLSSHSNGRYIVRENWYCLNETRPLFWVSRHVDSGQSAA